MLGVFEYAVDFEDVLVVEECLQFYLQGELSHHHVVLNHLLRNLLQRVNTTCLDVICLIHSTKLAPAQLCLQNKILNADRFPVARRDYFLNLHIRSVTPFHFLQIGVGV